MDDCVNPVIEGTPPVDACAVHGVLPFVLVVLYLQPKMRSVVAWCVWSGSYAQLSAAASLTHTIPAASAFAAFPFFLE